MVFFFTTEFHKDGDDAPTTYELYMGRDKYENELLIRWAWPEDHWFHADKLSSAHVYLRLPRGGQIEDVPAQVIMDCAQLTKANSIAGCKEKAIDVVHTPATNLKKSGDMDVLIEICEKIIFYFHETTNNDLHRLARLGSILTSLCSVCMLSVTSRS
jgi:hypothetical protein